MEAKDIIKALELCTSGDIYCGECPYENIPRCRCEGGTCDMFQEEIDG